MVKPLCDYQITFLPTPDMEATHRFYHDICGFELELDQGVCRIYKTTHRAFVGFCQCDEMKPEGNRVVLTIVSDEVDRWYELLTSNGVETDGEPRKNDKIKIYHFYAKDPNGYSVEVQSFLDPEWSP
ncbi:MAG: VOC family protein [Fimbriimonadaceae bacterium]